MDKSWIELFVAWLPVLVIFGVWFYFMRKGGGLSYGKYMEQHLEETRRHNDVMERLVSELVKRSERAP